MILGLQESELDADSISSRFRFLVPIMLGVSHIMACILWDVGTAGLPDIFTANTYLVLDNGTYVDADNNTIPTPLFVAHNISYPVYEYDLMQHWLGAYGGGRLIPLLLLCFDRSQCC